jgi:hypothetical protein
MRPVRTVASLIHLPLCSAAQTAVDEDVRAGGIRSAAWPQRALLLALLLRSRRIAVAG